MLIAKYKKKTLYKGRKQILSEILPVNPQPTDDHYLVHNH